MVMFYFTIKQFLIHITGNKNGTFTLELSSAIIAVLYALSSMMWFESIHAKGAVYMSAMLLVLCGFYAATKNLNTGSARFMYLAFYLSGFFTSTHSSAALYSVFVIVLMIFANRKKFDATTSAFSVFFFFLAFLTPYIYLFIRSSANIPVNFDFISTPSQVFDHILRKVYVRDQTENFDIGVYFMKFSGYFGEYIEKYNIAAVFAVIGAIAYFRVSRRTAAFLLIFFISNIAALAFAMNSSAGFDLNSTSSISQYAGRNFYMIGDVIPSLLAGYGLFLVIGFFEKKYGIKHAFLMFLICVPVTIMGFINFDINNHSRSFLAYDHAMNIEKSLKSGDTLMARGDVPLFNIVYEKTCLNKFASIRAFDREVIYLDGSILSSIKKRDKESVDTVESAICTSNAQSCYFTGESDFADKKIYSIPYGIIYKMSPSPVPVPGSFKISEFYSIRDYFNNSNNDFYYNDITARYFVMAARYLAMTGDRVSADNYLKLAFKTAPTSPEVLNELAVTSLYYMGDIENAIDYVTIIYKNDRHNMNAVRLLVSLFKQRNPVRALEWLNILYKSTNDLTEKANLQADIDAIKNSVR
jgi:tetratricopeptide (TPR) repeat protein